ncbi:serine hydrolase domain-containing protein [Pseudomonas putida]|uniref:serine hydrolase domain-containing protein n=1 Tax=Pseudomonas putida TaxID=303 RepID=UPI0039E08D1E
MAQNQVSASSQASTEQSVQGAIIQVDQSARLPASAERAGREMLEANAGGFAVVAGQGDRVESMVRFGDIQPETQYPIASASKWLTAAVVMTVVEEKGLSLDTPISTWLPKITGERGQLTLRQLLSQTPGLAGSKGEFYDLNQDHRMTLADSALEVASRPLISKPGEVFAYGGPGFQIAGAVAEAATGKRWAQLFDEKIAKPLGMTHTYWIHLRLDTEKQLPVSETLNPVLQGGVVSTASDYTRFLSMIAQGGVFEGKRLLSNESVDAMLRDQTPTATMTPTGANVLADAHYSLGSWCESWDSSGACVRNSSIGLFGVYPWVERESKRFGLIFIYQRQDAFRLWPQMEIIRDSLVGSSAQ